MSVVQMTLLGRYGRFANCHFQSMFLRCYSELHGLRVEAPDFPGQEIFDFHFDPVGVQLPVTEERYRDNVVCEPLPPAGGEFINKDVRGYFQFHTSWHAPWREMLLKMFSPNRSPTIERCGGMLIGLHARLGDYDNRTIKWRCPAQWYIDWLNENWRRLENPVLYIASEEPQFVERLVQLAKPGTPASEALMNRLPSGESFVDDWINLRACDILLIPNSTFSFTAAMMASKPLEAWRASLPHRGFVRFDPWNATPLLYDRAEDYRNLLDQL